MKRPVLKSMLVLGLSGMTLTPLLAQADTARALKHVARAKEIAGSDITAPLFLCGVKGNAGVEKAFAEGKNRQAPVQAFDNLWYLGTSFVGVWVLKTSEGLILFDAGVSPADARDNIVPELKSLGLDPAQIKYVLVTHGHWDHYGGAQYFQDNFGSRIGLTGPDWYMMARLEADSPARMNIPRPREDLVITDGQKVTLGDTTVTLYITPGHTPGTLSAIIPVRDGKATHNLSLLGGTAFPPTVAPGDRNGGLSGFSKSVERLADLSKAAAAEGLINTHTFVDGSAEHLRDAAKARAEGKRNPFLVGTDLVVKHYQVFNECLKAAMERPEDRSTEWSRPLPKDPQP
jgi:metallo-beta-lactamase class B